MYVSLSLSIYIYMLTEHDETVVRIGLQGNYTYVIMMHALSDKAT